MSESIQLSEPDLVSSRSSVDGTYLITIIEMFYMVIVLCATAVVIVLTQAWPDILIVWNNWVNEAPTAI